MVYKHINPRGTAREGEYRYYVNKKGCVIRKDTKGKKQKT